MLPVDHLDLLVTAGRDWNVFCAGVSEEIVLTMFGQMIWSTHLAAERARAERGHMTLAEVAELNNATPRYKWAEVYDPFTPMDVLKATHAAMQACAAAPGTKAGAGVMGMLERLAVAAAERLPGYDESPWHWTRAVCLTPVIGFAGHGDEPTIPGLVWVEASDLEEVWGSAVMVVLTPEALEATALMPRRPRLVVMTTNGQELDEAQWQLVGDSNVETFISLPAGQAWLQQQIETLNSRVSAAAAH